MFIVLVFDFLFLFVIVLFAWVLCYYIFIWLLVADLVFLVVGLCLSLPKLDVFCCLFWVRAALTMLV